MHCHDGAIGVQLHVGLKGLLKPKQLTLSLFIASKPYLSPRVSRAVEVQDFAHPIFWNPSASIQRTLEW